MNTIVHSLFVYVTLLVKKQASTILYENNFCITKGDTMKSQKCITDIQRNLSFEKTSI